MFKFILILTAILCIFAAPAKIMAQEVYLGDDHIIHFWDEWDTLWIDASAAQDGVVIEIDFDPNRIEIEVNGEDYDLPIGQNQHIPYREIRLMRLCKHSCRTVMTMWNATGTLN